MKYLALMEFLPTDEVIDSISQMLGLDDDEDCEDCSTSSTTRRLESDEDPID